MGSQTLCYKTRQTRGRIGATGFDDSAGGYGLVGDAGFGARAGVTTEAAAGVGSQAGAGVGARAGTIAEAGLGPPGAGTKGYIHVHVLWYRVRWTPSCIYEER